jgi:hypothetical protein
MADNRVDTPSVVERTPPIAPAGTGIVDAHFLGRTAAFVRGAEAILLASPEDETRPSPPAAGPASRSPPRPTLTSHR